MAINKNELKRAAKTMLQEEILARKIILGPDSPHKKTLLSEYLDDIFHRIFRAYKITLNSADLKKLKESIISDFVGYGLVDPLLKDPHISDIMVNRPDQVYVEKSGKLEKTNITFEDDDQIFDLINKMLTESGKRLDRSCPYVDLRLSSGIRVTAAIPPITPSAPSIVIRKKCENSFTFKSLVDVGAISGEAVEFLKYCVISRLNILMSGGTGVGKTTIMNLILQEFVPDYSRIVTIEDTEEIELSRTHHHLKLFTQPPNIEGKGEITMEDLVKLSLHMRPDRIVIGEVRGEEAFILLQAINTGHEGSMCTIHANNCEDAVNRLHVLALMGKPNIPDDVVRRMIKSGVNIIIHIIRMGAEKKIAQISEFFYSGEQVVVKDIYALKRFIKDGQESAQLLPTGYIPSFADDLKVKGGMPQDFFKVKD